MALKSVAFLRNTKSQFGVLESFTAGLEEAFHCLGVKTAVFDFDDYESGKAIGEIVALNPDCTIGFNILLPEDSPLHEFKIPHYAPLCDSATYYPELRLTNHLVASFMEQDSFGFSRKLGVENIFFLPHAIASSSLLSKQQILGHKRDLDVVVPGSFVNPDAIRKIWEEQLSQDGLNAMLDLAEKVLASPHISHLQAFYELIEERGFFEKELMEKKLDYFSQLNLLEVYIRNIDRLRIVQGIEGHTVHIFCSKVVEPNWKQALKDKKNVQYAGEASFGELASIFARSKMVVNSIPTIKRGLHERLLLALSQGASVLSNENIFIAKDFYQPLATIEYLSPNYKAQIDDVLKDEQARLNDVISTHDIIRERHTWDVRAKTLVETLPPILEQVRKKL